MLKKIPLPIGGLVLAWSAMGNVLQLQGLSWGYWFCGFLAAVLAVSFLAKVILHPQMVWTDIRTSAVLASVAGAFTMALMQLATYLRFFWFDAAAYLWYLALLGHGVLLVWFTWRYLLKQRDPKQYYPTYFLIYAGIAVAAVTAPVFSAVFWGMAAFWLGLATYAVAFILVLIRYRMPEPIPEPFQPFLCLLTAPPSLFLAGYLVLFPEKSLPLVMGLFLVAQLFFFFVLTRLPRLLKLPFYPSYAAFGFPFVITAFAFFKTQAYFLSLGISSNILAKGMVFETLIALALVSYVTVFYIGFIINRCIRCTHAG